MNSRTLLGAFVLLVLGLLTWELRWVLLVLFGVFNGMAHLMFARAFALALPGRSVTVVDDTYNANPDSVLAAIDVLADLPGPRLLVLGDMGEVGVNGAAFHTEVGQHAQAKGIERLFTLGDLAQASASAHAAATHFGDMAALQAAVLAQAAQGGSVLVKGSRFMRMERVVQALREHASAQEATCS